MWNYGTKIYSNGTNELIRDLIPCQKKSTNEIGMYDAVTGDFLTNSGTGELVAGPKVPHTSRITRMVKTVKFNQGDDTAESVFRIII